MLPLPRGYSPTRALGPGIGRGSARTPARSVEIRVRVRNACAPNSPANARRSQRCSGRLLLERTANPGRGHRDLIPPPGLASVVRHERGKASEPIVLEPQLHQIGAPGPVRRAVGDAHHAVHPLAIQHALPAGETVARELDLLDVPYHAVHHRDLLQACGLTDVVGDERLHRRVAVALIAGL